MWLCKNAGLCGDERWTRGFKFGCLSGLEYVVLMSVVKKRG